MSTAASRDQDRIRWLHDVVRKRGWQLTPFDEAWLDAEGYPSSPQPMWFYPHSFAGAIPQQIEELSPQPLRSFYSLDAQDAIAELVIMPAGNDQGCPQHARTVQHLPPDTLHTQLADALSHAEQHAHTLDSRALIECRFFGPCGQAWDEHGNPRR